MTNLRAELAALGFYKFVTPDGRDELDGDIDDEAYDLYLAAERAFDGDAERLAEGGIRDLLQSMARALEVEGVTLPEIEEVYSERGYSIRAGTDSRTIWSEDERKHAWALTTTRVITLINEWLVAARSDERVHVLGGLGGHDAVFVLLTPRLRQAIAKSGVFREEDIPVALG